MKRLVLALLIMSAPAWATSDGWPALYDVTGVEADDVLNIRAEPSASSEIIGALAHDATDIEVIRPDDEFYWGRVNVGERAGWVSLSYIVQQPGQWYGQRPAIRSCFGTEPFWGLTIEEDAVTFSTPDIIATGQRNDAWSSLNRRDLHAFSIRVTPEADGAETLDGVAMVHLTQCTDFMSDREYGIQLDMLIGDMTDQELYSGCCTIAPPGNAE